MPAALRQYRHDLIHLLDWEQRTEARAVAGLSAALAVRGRPFRPRRSVGWVGRWGTGGIGRRLAQAGFQLADPLVQNSALPLQGGAPPPERRDLVQEGREVGRRPRRPEVRRPQ